jgi:hypothetical protein
VARLTSLGESLLHVVGISRALEILQVAGYAGRARDVVVVVDVALAALRSRVRPG